MAQLSEFAASVITFDRESFEQAGLTPEQIDQLIDDINVWSASDAGRAQFEQLRAVNASIDTKLGIVHKKDDESLMSYSSGTHQVSVDYEHLLFVASEPLQYEIDYGGVPPHFGSLVAHEIDHAINRDLLAIIKGDEFAKDTYAYNRLRAAMEEHAIAMAENPARDVFGLPHRDVRYGEDIPHLFELAEQTWSPEELRANIARFDVGMLNDTFLREVVGLHIMSEKGIISGPNGEVFLNLDYSEEQWEQDVAEEIALVRSQYDAMTERLGVVRSDKGVAIEPKGSVATAFEEGKEVDRSFLPDVPDALYQAYLYYRDDGIIDTEELNAYMARDDVTPKDKQDYLRAIIEIGRSKWNGDGLTYAEYDDIAGSFEETTAIGITPPNIRER